MLLPILINIGASVCIILEDLAKKLKLKVEANDGTKVASLGRENKVKIISLISNALIIVQNLYTLWTQTIILTGGAVNNAPQETQDQARENTPQRLLAGCSLAELSLAELNLTQPMGYDWWD